MGSTLFPLLAPEHDRLLAKLSDRLEQATKQRQRFLAVVRAEPGKGYWIEVLEARRLDALYLMSAGLTEEQATSALYVLQTYTVGAEMPVLLRWPEGCTFAIRDCRYGVY